MRRLVDINSVRGWRNLGIWQRRSMVLFARGRYLDKLLRIYPFLQGDAANIDPERMRAILQALNNQDGRGLITELTKIDKFPYDEPVWYLLKTVKGCRSASPRQEARVVENLLGLDARRVEVAITDPPKINTAIGPLFNAWLREEFRAELKLPDEFEQSESGLSVLDASEEDGLNFVRERLRQRVEKRPDVVAKVNRSYVIGEAKWIGQPGGKQYQSVKEVVDFCAAQHGAQVLRVGIVDGFPWATRSVAGRVLMNKEAVTIQESTATLLTALLLRRYLQSL